MSFSPLLAPFRPLVGAALLLLFLCLPAAGADPGPQPLPAGNRVEKALARDFPQVMPEYQRVLPTPVEGLYEIQTRKGLIYYFPDNGHVLAGQLMDSSGRNLTRESINRQMQEKLADLPLDAALKIGSGPNTVIEFTDPDCPYCREGAKFWSGREDATRYVFFYPLPNHPQAEPKARYILAADDPERAYEDVMSGAYDQQPLPEFEATGRLEKHLQAAEEMGIRSTPSYWINGTMVTGANVEAFEQLLVKQPAAAPKQDKVTDQPPASLKKYAR